MALREVLLLSLEPRTVTAVTAALESNGQLSKDNVLANLSEVAARLERGGVPAVLVDLDETGPGVLEQLEPLIRRHPDTRFLLLSSTLRSELLLEAMQIGVRNFMLKDAVPADLAATLHRLCPDTPVIRNGHAIAVLSAGGGCGATTVAVNLASELQSAEKAGPALVVDLDPCYGAVGAYFGIDGDYGLFDVLRRSGDIDGQLVQSTALSPTKELHVMLATSRKRLGGGETLDAARLGQAIDACRSAYRYTVIDAPRLSMEAAGELARRTTAMLVLMQLTIKDIHVARQMLQSLREAGVPTDRVLPFASRYRRRAQMIGLDDAQKALGLAEGQTLQTLSNDFAAVTEAVNVGRPLSAVSPRVEIRRELQKLATQLAGMSTPVMASTPAPRAFSAFRS